MKATAAPRMLKIDPDTTERTGIVQIQVQSISTNNDILELLSELKGDPCVHTWNALTDLNRSDLHGYLVEFENKKRPTEIFYYYCIKNNGEKEILGIGTVAHKIKNTFIADGFPVIARCYIKQKYRENRFYFQILLHRFEFCQQLYGSNLKAVHLGSHNPRVFNVIKKNIFGLPFVYVGDEYLPQNHGDVIVRDYIWFSAQIKEEILSIPRKLSGPSVEPLISLLQKMFENKFDDTDYAKLLTTIYDVEREQKKTITNSNALANLVQYMSAIGVEIKYQHEPFTEELIIKRAS